ncbi:hypothetical protein [Acidaminococcus massiliensis]|uniref:hypothetical protein n=1 Tax=Acidaminococcus massiliensis TaxID=1852375 RepID=UPI00248D4EAA|nr:hypothetical protein [Acidaminococcus massiliensis]
MNLQQTLQQTDLPRLAACAAHRHVASQAGRETLDTFLRYVCELEPVLPDETEILIPGSWYDAGEKHLTADLYRTADLEKTRKDWKPERFYSQDELAAMEPDTRKALFNSLSQNSPQALDYTPAPWAETLAAEVRMLDSFTLEERLDFLAAAVLEMAYYGFTPNDHARNVERLEAAVRELDKTKITDFWEIESTTEKTDMETDPDEWIDSILQLQDTVRMLQVLF